MSRVLKAPALSEAHPVPVASEVEASAAAKPLRSDGLEARTRLLDAALVLFADHGFAKTSTRDIAQAAQANVASIRYYFGDKAGLYREVFNDPRTNPQGDPALINAPGQSLEQSLGVFLSDFIAPLLSGAASQSCMKLHFREMLEPTGLWDAEIKNNIQPAHEALVSVLCRHLGVTQADDDVHRLAFSIAGLGMVLHVGCDVIQAIQPQLIATPAAIGRYGDYLLQAALALVEAEMHRRAGLASTA
jgi:TetR/AcrR family transcriptional regulator, regulator of cefoperazone and chloramphenicol sensitivity